MKIRELHKFTVDRSKELNETNHEYYKSISSYIRTSNVSQKHAEEILLELLDHLLFAQNEGKNAYGIFGKNPKDYCEELMATLPKKKRTKWLFYAIIYLFFLVISFFLVMLPGMNFASEFLFLQAFFYLIPVFLTEKLIHNMSFKYKTKTILFIALISASVVTIAVYYLLNLLKVVIL